MGTPVEHRFSLEKEVNISDWMEKFETLYESIVREGKILPEYILSNTRGTAQKIVGFSSPISSVSNLTSYGHD